MNVSLLLISIKIPRTEKARDQKLPSLEKRGRGRFDRINKRRK
ncbi:hypothetical protein L278_08090 [Mannheimia haemolytica D35]|nr:hypothetical protein L278_08090 [Mannheimia haemolytica D35]